MVPFTGPWLSMCQPESQQAEMSNNLQLATSIDLKLGQIKISALKLKWENLTVHRIPVLAM
jgi:hypothetical protein